MAFVANKPWCFQKDAKQRIILSGADQFWTKFGKHIVSFLYLESTSQFPRQLDFRVTL